MANFFTLAFIDTLELVGSLRTRWGQFKVEDEGHRILRIRGHAKGSEESDDRFGGYEAAKKWVELANLRSEIARRAETVLPPGVDFGHILFEMLDPGATLDWRQLSAPYFTRWTRAILPLRTNPATLSIYGTETASLAPGLLTIVSPRLPHAAINMGEHPWVWLTMDFRKKNGADNG
jgi:Aspartyl/Asparaginyl beta-hydroxylase